MAAEMTLESIENKWKRLQELCWLEDSSGTGANLQIHLKKKLTPQEQTFLEEVMSLFIYNTDANNYVMRMLNGREHEETPPAGSSKTSDGSAAPEHAKIEFSLPEDNIFLPPLPLLPDESQPTVSLLELHVALLEGFSLDKGQMTPVPIEDIKRVNHWLAREQYQVQNTVEHPENSYAVMFGKFQIYLMDLYEVTALKLKRDNRLAWLLVHMNPISFLKHVKDIGEYTLYGMAENESGGISFAELSNISHMRSRSHNRSSRSPRTSLPPRPFC